MHVDLYIVDEAHVFYATIEVLIIFTAKLGFEANVTSTYIILLFLKVYYATKPLKASSLG